MVKRGEGWRRSHATSPRREASLFKLGRNFGFGHFLMSANCIDYMSRPDIQATRHVIVAPDVGRLAALRPGLLRGIDARAEQSGHHPRNDRQGPVWQRLLRPDERTSGHGTAGRLEKPYAIERSPREAAELLSSPVPIT